MTQANNRVEYMCSWCGKKVIRFKNLGRPMPGICPKKNNKKPHTWVKNRVF